jgi:hypothetical protein
MHFRRIGIPDQRDGLETLEAQHMAARVKRELERRAPGPSPCGTQALGGGRSIP